MSSTRNLRSILIKATLMLCIASLLACESRVSSPIERASLEKKAPVEKVHIGQASTPKVEVPALPAPLIVNAASDPAGVVVMMHGYNSTHQDFEPVTRLAERAGLVGMSLPAPIVNAPSRYQWERDDVEATHHYIQRAISSVRAGLDAPVEKVWLAGFSQGGMYAALLAARYPERYQGGLAIAPAGWASVPDEGACPEVARQVVVFTGEAERPRFAEKTAQVVAFLKSCSMLQEVVTHPGGHQFPADWPKSFGAIFERWAS